jgi:hypothetical protein
VDARHKAGHDARRLYKSDVDSHFVRIFDSPDSYAACGRKGGGAAKRSEIQAKRNEALGFVFAAFRA